MTKELTDQLDQIRSTVLAVPAVLDLDGGALGEIATYLPGRRVAGIRVTQDDALEVHIVADLSQPLMDTASHVRTALTLFQPSRVDVVIEDVSTRDEYNKTSDTVGELMTQGRSGAVDDS